MDEYKCINCDEYFPKEFSYCPDCGSKIQYVKKVSPRKNKLFIFLGAMPIAIAIIYFISPIDFFPDYPVIGIGWIDDIIVGIGAIRLRSVLKGVSKTVSSNPLLKKIPVTKSGPYPNMFVDKKGYPRFKNSGKLVHKAVAKNKVGGTIFSGYDVHHIDGNKLNFRKSNLQVLSHSKHSKLHWLKKNK